MERRFWEALCDVIDLPERRHVGDWSTGMDPGEGDAYIAEKALIQERIASRTLAEWLDVLHPTGIPFAPVLTPEEALASEQARVNQVLGSTTLDGEHAYFVRTPINLRTDATDEVQVSQLPPPPRIGEHNQEVLDMLGIGYLADRLPGPGRGAGRR
jgi:crotonobetainyl-CoA:carnitine CoA-transferase CaiB-like acyl-CoA transferase